MTTDNSQYQLVCEAIIISVKTHYRGLSGKYDQRRMVDNEVDVVKSEYLQVLYTSSYSGHNTALSSVKWTLSRAHTSEKAGLSL